MAKDAFACGGLAGAAGVLMTQPLDAVRIRMQTSTVFVGIATEFSACRATGTQDIGFSASFRHLLQTEGLGSLYRGALAPVLTSGARSALIFLGYDAAMQPYRKCGARARAADHAIAGAAGGLLASPVTNVAELVKCRAQVDSCLTGNQASSWLTTEKRVLSTIVRHEGFRGLFCGLGLTATRDCALRGTFFPVYESVSYSLDRASSNSGPRRRRPFTVSVVAGAAAGIVSWLPAYAVDVVKTHWQTGRRFGMSTVPALVANRFTTNGPQWFFRGLSPTLVRAGCMNAIVLPTYEFFRTVLVPKGAW